jgi:hypothetical protein
MVQSVGRLAGAVATAAETDRAVRLPALARWAARLSARLRRHQNEEERHGFPELVERVPTARALVERLDADDRELDKVLDDLAGALADLADRRPPFAPAQRRAAAITAELQQLLVTHVDDEDANFLPLLERHTTRAEHAAQLAAMAARVPRADATSLLPWLLASCSDAERADVRAAAPRRLRAMGRLGAARYRRAEDLAFGPSRVWTPSAY